MRKPRGTLADDTMGIASVDSRARTRIHSLRHVRTIAMGRLLLVTGRANGRDQPRRADQIDPRQGAMGVPMDDLPTVIGMRRDVELIVAGHAFSSSCGATLQTLLKSCAWGVTLEGSHQFVAVDQNRGAVGEWALCRQGTTFAPINGRRPDDEQAPSRHRAHCTTGRTSR